MVEVDLKNGPGVLQLKSLSFVASESAFQLLLMGPHRHHELGQDHEIQGHSSRAGGDQSLLY